MLVVFWSWILIMQNYEKIVIAAKAGIWPYDSKVVSLESINRNVNMNAGLITRLVILGFLWLLVAVYVLTHAQITFFTLFAVAVSGVIILVPVYKKYRTK